MKKVKWLGGYMERGGEGGAESWLREGRDIFRGNCPFFLDPPKNQAPIFNHTP